MATSALTDWLTWSFSPSPSAILLTLIVSLSLPVLLHFFLYRKSTSNEPPTFVLIGPSGGGKTSLLTLFSTGTVSETHISQTTQAALCRLPSDSHIAASDSYRSSSDPSTNDAATFRLIDTPGHGKLRSLAVNALFPTPRGLIFVVDSAAISAPAGLSAAAEFLHDVLLALQRGVGAGGKRSSSSTRVPNSIPVCVLANKQDVFSSLPATLVSARLESEIARVRSARSKGLLDSAVSADADAGSAGAGGDDEAAWLGEYGSQEFRFAQMLEHGVEIEVVGADVRGEGNSGVAGLWGWIAGQL